MAVQLTPQRRTLAMAASQVGYSRWSDPHRGTKYARETQPVFWPRDHWLLANGISYCDLFVTWVFWKALGEDFVRNHLPGGASYNTDYRASKGGRISKREAQPGDILVFDWNWSTPSTNHVGILEKNLASGNFQTIEGNTSVGAAGSQSNGGRVARRVRRRAQVRYVLRPNWAKAGGTTETVAVLKKPWNNSRTIQSLSKAETKEIQSLLKSKGYDLGSYGVDGSYGESTYKAVRAFQTKAGLAVDGVAGPVTVRALKASSRPPAAPPFPLPRKPGAMYYYGRADGPKTSVSGKSRNSAVPNDVTKDANGRYRSKGLYAWQKKAGIAADGRFGDQTEAKVKSLQRRHGQKVDGKIGPDTWQLPWLG